MSRAPLLVIAHRGASGHRPENTLVAFEHAIALGASMVELDAQLTRDGRIVVLHDETLDRTTNGFGPLREKTLAEVRTLDAGSWFGRAFAGARVPTLDEAVELLAGRARLNLELKGDDAPGELESRSLAILERHGFLGDTVFSSFSCPRIERLRRLSGAARVAVLMDEGASWTEARAFAAEVRAEALHPERSLVRSRDEILESRSLGLEVRVWTVNQPEEGLRLRSFGIDGLFTDFPERFP